MVEPESGSNELQVLILGENVQDSEILHNVFADAEIDATVCKDLQDLHAHLLHDAGLLLMAEEALNPHEAGPLMETLCEQPPWSDLPILLLVHAAGESERADWVTAMLGNVTLLERPVHKAELLSAVRSALRARRRQYEVRDYLHQRDQTEQAVRRNEERFRAFFDLAAVGIGEAEPQAGRFTRVNDRLCQITGYSREELLSMDIGQLTHPEDRADSLYWFNRLMAGEIGEYSLEKRYIRKDGQIIWVLLHVTAVRDEHGRPLVSFGVVQDIDQRKRATHSLQREWAFLRKVIDASPSLVFVKDRQGRYVLGNEALARCYGTSTDGFIGKTGDELNPIAEQVSHFRRDDLEVMDSRRPKVIPEEPLTYADGQAHWVRTVKVPLVNDDGTCDHVLGVAVDITELKHAKEQLLSLNATLEQRVAERTAEAQQRAAQLSAMAAELTLTEQRERQRLAEILHDHLQQLLVGARFNVSLLRSRTDIPHLQASLQRVAELLDDSLRTSRSLTAELSPPVLRQGTLADVLRWLAEWMQEKHGLRVHLKADEQVNPPAEEIRLLLFQAARELLFNIVKHAGVQEASMELSRLDEQNLSLAIADAGRGFDPSPQPARPESGFGLLSIRERLYLLGGCMDIQSAVGQGTRATLIAPMHTPTTRPEVTQTPATAPHPVMPCPVESTPAAPRSGRIRVLLADDHRVVRDGLAQLLQTCEGIEIIAQASDGQEAVDLARQMQPDVVIMDVSMPRLGGIEATRLLHAEMPETCIIGLSMHTEPTVAEAMTAAGATAYLAKTAPPESLVAAILERHGNR